MSADRVIEAGGVTARLMLGDCYRLLPMLGPVDVVLTDPPYLNGDNAIETNHSYIGEVRNPSQSVGLPWGFDLDWIDLCAASSPRHWVVFCNYAMLGRAQVALERYAKVMSVFVWRYSNAPRMARPVPRLDCQFILWAKHPKASCGRMKEFDSLVLDVPMLQAGCMADERILMPGTGRAAHPCQKPLAVVRPFVERLMGPGATVLDPFMGSGTTGEACLRTGRNFVGIESDPGYFDLACRRLSGPPLPLFDRPAPAVPDDLPLFRGAEPGGGSS